MTHDPAIGRETIQTSELVRQTFEFWLTDKEHIRSPFPSYIHNELKQVATERFAGWARTLSDDSKAEMNDEMIGEKFEEIIFDVASQLVKTEDEKLTVLYPFLPRTGDRLIDGDKVEGQITDRFLLRRDDKSYLQVTATRNDRSTWTTEFELPI